MNVPVNLIVIFELSFLSDFLVFYYFLLLIEVCRTILDHITDFIKRIILEMTGQ